ncbi:MAG: metallophosphoesterase [Planctomycetota bacterium]
MAFVLQVVLLLAALAGHAVLWVGIVNRIHGVGISRWVVDGITWVSGVALFGVPLYGLLSVFQGAEPPVPFVGWSSPWWLTRYAELSALILVAASGGRLALAGHGERRGALLSVSEQTIDLHAKHGETLTAAGVPRLLSRLPGNQLLRPVLSRKELLIPGLPAALDGLRIAHLTDLHMSGRVAIDYFREIIDATNAEQPDLVALTGDLVEFNPQLDWLDETLCRLTAHSGVYFVRGNHDREMDHRRMADELTAAGHIDLGCASHEAELRGQRVHFVGNELPWFRPAGNPAGDGAPVDLTIALAHGPDQFGWAARHDVDLILAGHNHGGQIRFPLLGALVTPSVHGTRYACGTFRRGGTVMHVSRGAGSLAPVRFNCAPELAILTLRARS